jgi:alanine racemase
MDMSLVDVTDIADVQWGDPVTLFGEDPSVHEIADLLDTIAYEILCGISPRVPRILVD